MADSDFAEIEFSEVELAEVEHPLALFSLAPANRVLLLLSLVFSCLFLSISALLKISHTWCQCFRGREMLNNAVINWTMTLAKCQSFAHASIVSIDITSITHSRMKFVPEVRGALTKIPRPVGPPQNVVLVAPYTCIGNEIT